MDRSELQASAEFLVEAYRECLNIDPYFGLKVEMGEGDFISQMVEDRNPAAWVLKLNPERHGDLVDIQYSVIDSLVKILFRFVDKNEHVEEAMSRLTTNFVQLLPLDFEESELEESDPEYEAEDEF